MRLMEVRKMEIASSKVFEKNLHIKKMWKFVEKVFVFEMRIISML